MALAEPTAPPWPGTPGGAYSPHWGENIRLYVWCAIYAGTIMKWGSVSGTIDTLDNGNVFGPVITVGPPVPAGQLWVDVTCDVLELETNIGTSEHDVVVKTSAESPSCSFTLRDPTRKYDPTNPDSPYQFGGRTRLGPGTGIKVFAETLTGASTITRFSLHTGTVDSWGEDWTPHPTERQAKVVASGAQKQLVRLSRPASAVVGVGEFVDTRLNRILSFVGSTITKRFDVSYVREAGTTLDGNAWDLLTACAADEIGYLAFDADNILQFFARDTLKLRPTIKATVGCPGGLDVLTDATTTSMDTNMVNSVTGSRPSGPVQFAKSQTSIDQYGEYGLRRTDLGVFGNGTDETDVTNWVNYMLSLAAFPRPRLEDVTLVPAFLPTSWPTLLGIKLADGVKVVWTPPGTTSAYDIRARVFGIAHTISFGSWEMKWSVAYADIYSRIFHWGPDVLDRLNAGNVYV